MKKRNKHLLRHGFRLLVFFLCSTAAADAATTPGENPTRFQDDEPVKELGMINYFGTLKAKYELDTETGMSRFSVRNSRVGIKGDLTHFTSYKFQLELSNNGEFRVLDLFGTLRLTPQLTVSLGQVSLPIYNGYTISPGELMFANRPFIGKYFTGSREIGMNAQYTFNPDGFPVILEAGIYNGGEINEPVWTDRPSYAGRLSFGSMQGFRSTVKAYRYPKTPEEDYLAMGIDFRYAASRWRVESEFMTMKNYADRRELSSWYVQGAYAIPCRLGKILDHVTPALRWDEMGYDAFRHGFDVRRLTAGIGFSLTEKPFSSILRLDYEIYILPEKELYRNYFPGENFDNKLTLELQINF